MRNKEDHIKNTLKVIRESEKERSKYLVSILGRDFVVYPNVFSPKYFSDTNFFVQKIPFEKGINFLDMGCGIGVKGIFAALNGASQVIATDINPDAVANTKENAELNGVLDKVQVFEGDVYSSIPKDLKFDIIFWNMPFLDSGKSIDDLSFLERSVFDLGYESFREFIRESKNRLKENGKIIIGLFFILL